MKYEESASQMAVVEYCRIKGYPYNCLYAIENEGKRTAQSGVRAKAMGKMAGIPDLCLPVMRSNYGALYIEMKAPKGRVSAAQVDAIAMLRKEGYRVEVCYSHTEAIATIEWYISGAGGK